MAVIAAFLRDVVLEEHLIYETLVQAKALFGWDPVD
jgi:hypothetical protein